VLEPSELRRRFPQFATRENDLGVLDVEGGAIRPEVAVLAAADLAEAGGAELRYGTRVTAIDSTHGGVRVQTTTGEVHAATVIVTAGSWTTRLLPDLRDVLRVSLHALMWMMPRDPSLFMPEVFPGFMRDLDGAHAFGVPSLDGYSIKMTPTIPGLPQGEDRAQLPAELTRAQVEWAGGVARAMIPSLVAEPVRWSLHADSRTTDRRPVIDTLDDGRVVIVGGMSGNGFKFAPVYGELIARAAIDGPANLPPSFALRSHRERMAHRRESGSAS
jgi:sarcosine oxidase